MADKFEDLLNTKDPKDGRGKYLKPAPINIMRRATTDLAYDPNVVYGLGTPIDETVVAELNSFGKTGNKYINWCWFYRIINSIFNIFI